MQNKVKQEFIEFLGVISLLVAANQTKMSHHKH